jgi:hypothetical protein
MDTQPTTMMEWYEKISKHGDGITAATASKDELGDYVATKVYVHTQENFTDYTLWTVFKEEFEGFTTEDFRRMRIDTRAKLRTHLLKRGVYVGKHNSRYSISEALFDLLQEEEPHEWTDEEITGALKEVSPMITVALREQLNSTQTALTSNQAIPPSVIASSVPTTPPHSPLPSHTVPTPVNHQLPPLPPTPVIQPIATATTPGTQIPTPVTPQPAVASIPQRTAPTANQQQAAPTSTQDQLLTLLTQLLQTQNQRLLPTATTSTLPPAAAPTPPGPPPAQYLHPSTANTDPAIHLPIYSKEVATIAKIYTDDQKYDGVSDSFDLAFPSMLKGLAQDHYYNSNLESRPFTEACNHMRQFFEGPEYYRKNLTEWNSMTLQGVMDENPDESIYQNFQLLIDKLLKQRHGLHPDFRTNRILTNKLVTACQGVPACRIAVSNPLEDLSQLISKLQSSIVAWEKEHPSQALMRPSH